LGQARAGNQQRKQRSPAHNRRQSNTIEHKIPMKRQRKGPAGWTGWAFHLSEQAGTHAT
jgi:hypothetical protein